MLGKATAGNVATVPRATKAWRERVCEEAVAGAVPALKKLLRGRQDLELSFISEVHTVTPLGCAIINGNLPAGEPCTCPAPPQLALTRHTARSWTIQQSSRVVSHLEPASLSPLSGCLCKLQGRSVFTFLQARTPRDMHGVST